MVARGEVMELVGADGVARVRVTAPAAYAAGGRRIDVHLRAGAQDSAGTSSIELFADGGGEPVLVDPVWKVVASMSSPRADHGAALTGTGKVLAAGGSDGKVTSLDSAALYDPAADAWTDVGPMNNAHVCHTETALTDGTVLVAGGMDQFTNQESAAEVFAEPAAWTSVGSMVLDPDEPRRRAHPRRPRRGHRGPRLRRRPPDRSPLRSGGTRRSGPPPAGATAAAGAGAAVRARPTAWRSTTPWRRAGRWSRR